MRLRPFGQGSDYAVYLVPVFANGKRIQRSDAEISDSTGGLNAQRTRS